MIMVECEHCHRKVKYTRQVCICGENIRRKIYWVRYSVNRKLKKEKLGEVALGYAKEVELRRRIFGKSHTQSLRDVFCSYGQKLLITSPRWAKTALPFLDIVEQFIGNKPVASITGTEAKRLQVWLLRTRSASTTDRIIATAKAAVNYCGLENPFAQVKLLKPKNDLVRYLTDEEEQELIRVVRGYNPTLYQIIVITLATGLRRANILELRRDQVDFDNGMVTVRQKGDKELVLPLSPGAVSILRSIPCSGPYFWPNPKTGVPYKDFKKSWATIKRIAGITKPFRWHDLRHHVAVKMLHKGVNLVLIRDILGHSDISVTTKYSHVKPDALRAVVDAIDPLIVPKSKNHR